MFQIASLKIIFTDYTEIFFSKLRSAALNYHLPKLSFFTNLYCVGVSDKHCLLTFFIWIYWMSSGKEIKMRGLSSNLSLFRNEFKKFNNTGALMLDSFYHMTLEILKNCTFGVETLRFSLYCTQCYNGRHYVSRKAVNHFSFIDFIAWRYFNLRRDVMW